MNIGIVTTWFDRGAAYVSAAYYETLKTKHNVFIYARGGEKYEYNNYWNKDFVTWGKRIKIGIPTYIDYYDFNKWIFKNKIQIIFFNEQQSWDIILKIRSQGIIIGSYIDYYTKDSVPLFQIYDFLVCNTKRHYEVFKWHNQCLYIPWGTNCSLYKPVSDPCRNSNKKEMTFFHSAGFNPDRKGTDLLIKAFSMIKEDAKLIIHTQIPLSNPERSSILSRDRRIEIIEGTVSPPGLYYQGDVYVYPSKLDGIGLTITEALACGLPVITTNNQPMNEFVINGFNGHLIPVKKFQKRKDGYYWKEAVCDIGELSMLLSQYASNKVPIQELKCNARSYAENFLNWESNSRELCSFIESVNRIPKKHQLVRRVIKYEYSRYPGLIFKAIFRKFHL